MGNDILWQLAFGVISLLGSVNAFFISRLIRKIDEAAQVSNEVAELRKDLQHINTRLAEIPGLSSRVIELEKKLAVLEYKASRRRSDTSGSA